ncbi:MAG: glycine cleavage system H protein [marine bacterium B5-7]|nr:MAG: glycine cleavage system H protein [marine bacterium B5-7]
MSELKYSKDHEWLRVDDAATVVVGISDFAQKQLGDVVYVELPEIGQEVAKDEDIAVVESVKAASDVKAPVSGIVLEINSLLSDEPEMVNTDPSGAGWFLKMKLSNPSEVNELMDEAAYKVFIQD